MFNLEHPDQLAVITEVDDGDDEDEDDDAQLVGDDADSDEDELLRRFNKMTFVVATRKLEQLPQWVKVSDVFTSDHDSEILERAGATDIRSDRYKKYIKRLAKLRGIRRYVYRMDVLERTLSYDEITEIFVRVNSLGAKLRSSDLALAQITAKWRSSLQILMNFQAECAKFGLDLDLGIHLKNLIAFATGQSRFLTVGSLTPDKLKASWTEACEGVHFTMNFLKSNAGIDSPALLSSPFLMVVLAYFGHARGYKIDGETSAKLRFWTLAANAKGRFSRGSSETILDHDLATIRDGGNVTGLMTGCGFSSVDSTSHLTSWKEEISEARSSKPCSSRFARPVQKTGARIWSSRSIIRARSTAYSFTTSSRRYSSRPASRHAKLTTSRTLRSSAARLTVPLATSHPRSTCLRWSSNTERTPSKLR